VGTLGIDGAHQVLPQSAWTLVPVTPPASDDSSIRTAPAISIAAEPGNEWHQWRGPHFNGASDATNIPDKFDDSTNVRWTTAMPGPGSGTPIVAADRIFVSALDKASKKLLAMCVSRTDGKILWSKEVGEGFQEIGAMVEPLVASGLAAIRENS